MTSRNRSRDLRTQTTGSYWCYLGPVLKYDTAYNGNEDWCTDTVEQWDSDNGLTVTHHIHYSPVLDGEQWSTGSPPFLVRKWVSYPITYRPPPKSTSAKYPAPNDSAKSAYAWELAARTNPSRPLVSLPTFLAELKDIPETVRGLGRTFLTSWKGDGWTKRAFNYVFGLKSNRLTKLEAAANANLTWWWCIRPLISDIRKMFQFSEAAQQRFLWLRRLSEGKSLKRRVTLGGDDSYLTEQVTTHSDGMTIIHYRDTHYSSRIWGTARWKTAVPAGHYLSSIPYDVQSQFDFADRLVRGVTCYEALCTAWELLPWSWFIDYFVGIGNFIAANNNSVGATPSGLCLMRHLTSKSTYRLKSKSLSQVSLTGAYYEQEEVKTRTVIQPYLSLPPLASLPFLTERQWSYLGSLAALRGGYRRSQRG